MPPPRRILPAIIFSQFAGTSLWFAGNAVLGDLARQWHLPADSLGAISSAVQLGFILGTLLFAILTIPDRISPRKLFLFSAIAGACSNVALLFAENNYPLLILSRFFTGFFLAGIYPVGMKIASGWYQQNLGKAIGFLVGALVLGTAFPFLLTGLVGSLPWQWVSVMVSVFAVCGGLVMFLAVPDGPHMVTGNGFEPGAMVTIFRSADFRASAFGYFGHMWELYAFWVYLPVFLGSHLTLAGSTMLNTPLWVFWIIAAGFVGCAVGGMIAQRIGSARVAVRQLGVSGLCCALSPILFFSPTPVFVVFLLIWGLTVVGDSPQFSTLNARTAPRQLVGSALTIVNCIGFAISIISIKLIGSLTLLLAPHLLLLALLPGPLLGLLSMRRLRGQSL